MYLQPEPFKLLVHCTGAAHELLPGAAHEQQDDLLGLTGVMPVSPNRKSYYADAYHCVYHAKYVEQTSDAYAHAKGVAAGRGAGAVGLMLDSYAFPMPQCEVPSA